MNEISLAHGVFRRVFPKLHRHEGLRMAITACKQGQVYIERYNNKTINKI